MLSRLWGINQAQTALLVYARIHALTIYRVSAEKDFDLMNMHPNQTNYSLMCTQFHCRKLQRTAKTTLPFKVLEDFSPSNNQMVHLEGETSNQLLDTLADWNTYLEDHVPYYQEPLP